MDNAIRKTSKKLNSIYYNSLYDFQTSDRCEENYSNKVGGQKYLDRDAGEDWYGHNEYGNGSAVIKRALLGDKRMYDNLQVKVSELDKELGTFTAKGVMQKVVKSRRVTVHGKFGDEIDIHKINSGKLDTAWSSKKRETFDGQHKLVTLFIDLSHNSNVNCKDTLWTTAVTVKLLADLEREGKSVKIIVGGTAQNVLKEDSIKHVGIGITVKEYNERLAPERLAAMSHLGFYRSWGFTAYHDHNFGTTQSAIGSALSYMNQKELPLNIQEEIEKGHTKLLIISKSTGKWQAVESIKSARKQIENF